MFESSPGVLGSDGVRALAVGLVGRGLPDDDVARVELIRALEELKSATAAVQARVTAAFVASQRAAQAVAGVPAERVGQGIAAQVGLAKRESPARAARYVGLATALAADLPETMAALGAGRVSEWRAQLVARATAGLSREQRRLVDAELGPRLHRWGDRQVEAEARRAAYCLDPRGFVARQRQAESDRRVTLRPAPDTMTWLSALLPVAQGVAVIAALRGAVDTARGDGDPRSRGQVMADTLVERVTGQASADAVPVGVTLVMTEHTLLGAGEEPGHLQGFGPVPAPAARDLVRMAAGSAAAEVWLRRLYAAPEAGQLVALDSRRRIFPRGLVDLLVARDQTCRTPWCDAPIRHIDHVVPAALGGGTSAANGQGLCEACNYAKQAPGWQARPGPGGAGRLVEIRTPTGHRYTSVAPDPPRHRRSWLPPPPRPAESSGVERALRELLVA